MKEKLTEKRKARLPFDNGSETALEHTPGRLRRLTKGYEQKQVYNEKTGKEETVVYYIGRYYCRSMPKAQLTRTKIAYTILAAAGLLAFFPAAAMYVPMNAGKLSAIIQTLFLLGALVLVCCMIKYLSASFEMTEKEYRFASRYLICAALITAIFSYILMLISAYYLFTSMEKSFSCLLCLLAYLFSGSCFATLFFIENHTDYSVRQSESGPDDQLL